MRCSYVPNYNPKTSEWDVFNSDSSSQSGIPDSFFNGEFPIFIDKANRITLHQFCIPCSVKLNFSLKFKNIEKAEYVSAALFHKIMNESVYQYSDVAFSYPIPDIMFAALYKFYKMQKLDPAVIPFKKYLEVGSNSVLNIMANRDDQKIKQNVALSNIANVLCSAVYESDTPENEKKGKVVNRYMIDFDLIYQFNKPNILTLSYPFMINNTPIPKILIPNSNRMMTDRLGVVSSDMDVNGALHDYQKKSDENYKYPLVQYPDIGFNVLKTNTTQEVIYSYKPIFVSILQIDESVTPNRLFINLEADVFPLMDGYVVERIRKSINSHAVTDLCLFLGLHCFSIMKNDFNPVSYDRVKIDKVNKTIMVDTNLDIKAEYKIVINQVRTLKHLKGDYIKEMLADPEYWDIVIYKNINYLLKHGYVSAVKGSYSVNNNAAANANPISNVHFYRNSYRIFDYLITPKR